MREQQKHLPPSEHEAETLSPIGLSAGIVGEGLMAYLIYENIDSAPAVVGVMAVMATFIGVTIVDDLRTHWRNIHT